MLLETQRVADALRLRLRGVWRIDNIVQIDAALRGVAVSRGARVIVDCGGVESMDLSGAWLLKRRLDEMQAAGAHIEYPQGEPGPFSFIDELSTAPPPAPERPQEPISLRSAVAWIGRESVGQLARQRRALGYFGRIAVTTAGAIGSLRRLRPTSIVRHVYETGIQAIPIVALIAFLISVIVAYLGAQQLRQFGAEIFTVDLVAISVLRELGVLLTAIMVAGRSGSAFAAEIGVMRLNDEVDALQSMGVDYFEVLVLPRLIGLLIALPLLTVIADGMGLAGGALLSAALLDISVVQFIQRVQAALAPTTFWAGLIKAPVFAVVISLVGTYRGMQVRDSSRELGRLTTLSVVQSIFLVIFFDAVFAVIFMQLDF